MISPARWGATPEEWSQFDLVLGLTGDLLPVVSNPAAVISPDSKMKALGKTPSRYNQAGRAAGIAGWTSVIASSTDIERWSRQPDYGICLQTRTVRAIDVDIPYPIAAGQVLDLVTVWEDANGLRPLPRRTRGDSGKFLLTFTVAGAPPISKRVLRCGDAGIIELLADGQQFIAAGTHPAGTRYEWAGGLPAVIPEVTLTQFEALWLLLQEAFGSKPASSSSASVKQAKLSTAAENDPTAVALTERGVVISTEKDGRLHFVCPFENEHTSDSAESATTYWPAHTGGYERGHFHCLHAHCENRSDLDFLSALGLAPDPVDDFEALPPVSDLGTILPKSGTIVPSPGTPSRFDFVPAHEFSSAGHPGWIIRGILPLAELAVIYGEPGSGKSFLALDMAAAIALGGPWAGRRVRQGRVGYLAAEGASGFRSRLTAYSIHHGIKLAELDLRILAASPSLMEPKDVIELGSAMRRAGPLSVLFIDTLAQVSSGANENSGEDMGRVLGHCRTLTAVTGAMVVLIHHAGKDSSRGARGWSGIKGAIDTEIEITRDDGNRTATVSKMKDGEDGERMGFRLAVVPLGVDDEGDPVSSCVVEHGAVVPRRTKSDPRGPHEKTIWRVASEMLAADNSGIDVKLLLDRCVEETPQDEDDRDRRRDKLRTALTALVSRGLLAVRNGAVVFPEKE